MYTKEGSVAAGRILSQMYFSQNQRATLTGGQYGVAAVMVGPDNPTSINATSLGIEALGVTVGEHGGLPR